MIIWVSVLKQQFLRTIYETGGFVCVQLLEFCFGGNGGLQEEP